MGCSCGTGKSAQEAPTSPPAPQQLTRHRSPTPSHPRAALANAQFLFNGGNGLQDASSLRPAKKPSKDNSWPAKPARQVSPGQPKRLVSPLPTLTQTAGTPHEDAGAPDGLEVTCWDWLCCPFMGTSSGGGSSGSRRPVRTPTESNNFKSQSPADSKALNLDFDADRTILRAISHETRTSSVTVTPKRRFVVTNRGRIQDVYAFEGRKLGHLGVGGYATVFKGQRKADGAIRAIKAINLQRTGRSTQALDRLSREIMIMKMMDHPGIIKLYEIWEDKKDLYLVMELCTGGELFGRICSAGRFTEEEAAIVMRQVMAAVVYMHEKGVCHRDLKPENFLFLSNAPIQNNALKLIDFGLSRTFEAGTAKFWTRIGTPYYVAPQVLQGCYDELIDVWSAGVLMYVLLCGYPPFMGDNDKEITEAVLRGRFEFAPEDWDMISEDAKELIAWMLAFRPEHRSSAKEVLDHVWIHDMAPRAHSTVPLCARRVQNLQKFCSMHPFKKATLGVIASLLHEDKIAELRDMFRGMDKNGTGVLSAHDLMEGMKKAGIGEIALDLLQMEQVVKACDENGSGGIDYTEFLAAAMDEAHYLQEDICWSAFCVFDRDGDGKISHAELCEVLHDDGVDMALARATAEELIKQIDRAGDGAISFDEFMQMLRDQH